MNAWLQGLGGGAMIGCASAAMLLGAGRIAGISGIASRVFRFVCDDRSFAIAFIIGLPLGARVARIVFGDAIQVQFPSRTDLLLIAGVLVGFGSRLASGCTSGHGVCGLSRLSKRSIMATTLFIAAAVTTVAAINALRAMKLTDF